MLQVERSVRCHRRRPKLLHDGLHDGATRWTGECGDDQCLHKMLKTAETLASHGLGEINSSEINSGDYELNFRRSMAADIVEDQVELTCTVPTI